MFLSVEKLSINELSAYFNRNGSFNNDEILFKERVRKLSESASFVTVRENDLLIATIGFYMNRPPLCYITHVSVDVAYRRRGLSTKMLNHLESVAIDNNYLKMRLEVKKHNIPAISAYEKVGYRIVSDASEDSFYMEKNN